MENNATTILTTIFSGTVSSRLIITSGATTLANFSFFISTGKYKRKASLSLKGKQNIVETYKLMIQTI